jgi:type I phosphodiesterase/nucleotide pyrophosphatase
MKPIAVACATIALAFGSVAKVPADEQLTRTENVLWVTLDGLRWQEVFFGAEESLFDKDRGGIKDPDEYRKRYARETVDRQRAALLPFLWDVVARNGQIFGNHREGSIARVTNGLNFSYPGYNELLCGFADLRIDSNDKKPNPNVTVLEWLNGKNELRGRLAAFTSWDVFPYIIHDKRSGVFVNSGHMPLLEVEQTPEVRLLNQLMAETPVDEEVRPDALTFHAAKRYLVEKKPRVLYLSFDETDTQAHAGRYDRVLNSAHKADGFISDLWETAQAVPEYRGKTTLIVTTDHGRGDPPVQWKDHNAKTTGSEFIWLAVMGPDTPALGERKNVPAIEQNQVAATVAALLGYDYLADVPKAGKAIADVLGRP